MPTTSDLVDRASERAVLHGLVAVVESGRSAALVVRGPVGIGKTALVETLQQTAAGIEVVVTAGVESEATSPYAFLHRFLLPHLPHRAALAPPLLDALETALGLRVSAAGSAYSVGLAVLALLGAATRTGALIQVVDDAHWADPESIAVLGYVARRVHAERLGLVFCVQEPLGAGMLPGLAELVLDGLPAGPAADLLVREAAGAVDRRVASSLVEHTDGNPLALRELGRGYTGENAPPLLDGALALGIRLDATYRERLAALPEDGRRLLLLHALGSGGDPGAVDRAAAGLGLRPEALLPAEAAGLVVLAPSLRFTSSLVKAAVSSGADPAERRQAHALLAEASDGIRRPDLRAWHLARAAAGPDEAIAAELERTAARARERGGRLAEAEFLAFAGRLTLEPERAAERFLRAAEAAFAAAAPLRAEAFLEAGAGLFTDPRHDGRALRLRALIAAATGRSVAAAGRDLLIAAERFTPADPPLAEQMLLEAVELVLIAGSAIEGMTTQEAGRAALGLMRTPRPDDDGPALLLRGLATLAASGYVEAAPLLLRAMEALPMSDIGAETPIWFVLGAFAAQALWDDRGLHEWVLRCEALARETGALYHLRIALTCVAGVESIFGDLPAAEAHIDESQEIALALGWPPNTVLALTDPVLAAWRGDDAETLAAVHAAEAAADLIHAGDLRRAAGHAMMLVHLGHARYEAALAVADTRRAADVVGFDNEALANLVEAAVRSGRREAAVSAAEELAVRAMSSGTPWALGVLARTQALLSETPERLYLVAITRLSETLAVADLARTHLLYGEWLRRERRRRTAQTQLTIAYHLFAGIGATAFSARARQELLAAGARPPDEPVLPTALTAQERRIVELAAAGRSNQAIAERLFISPHTVAYHLTKAFRKLGVTSRQQLRDRLEEPGPAG